MKKSWAVLVIANIPIPHYMVAVERALADEGGRKPLCLASCCACSSKPLAMPKTKAAKIAAKCTTRLEGVHKAFGVWGTAQKNAGPAVVMRWNARSRRHCVHTKQLMFMKIFR